MDFFQVVLDIFQIIASGATAIAVSVAVWQIILAKQQARTQFEDSLDREYREIAMQLPLAALLGEELSEQQQRDSIKYFFHYFNLCSGQILLRRQGRVSKETWEEWRNGMKFNMALPAFRQAWAEVKARAPGGFDGLRRVEKSGFQDDPRSW